MTTVEVNGIKYQKANPNHKDWETPPEFFRKLNEEFHFTLDAAASHENALCGSYCTPDGLFVKYAGQTHYKDADLDGLAFPWKDHRVFCNPPYDSSLYSWVEKAAQREAEVAVLLLPPSVDTAWFHRLLLEANQVNSKVEKFYDDDWVGFGNYNLTLLFRRGRLRFYHDGKPGMAPRAGNLLAIFRR